jgi:hypothetical protein
VEGGNIAEGPITILMTIRNAGKQTGFIEDANATAWTTKTLPEVPPYAKGGLITLHGPWTSGVAYSATLKPARDKIPVVLNAGDVKLLADGDARLFVFGYLTYRDRYSFLLGTTTLGFCGVYNLSGNQFENSGSSSYAYER